MCAALRKFGIFIMTFFGSFGTFVTLLETKSVIVLAICAVIALIVAIFTVIFAEFFVIFVTGIMGGVEAASGARSGECPSGAPPGLLRPYSRWGLCLPEREPCEYAEVFQPRIRKPGMTCTTMFAHGGVSGKR